MKSEKALTKKQQKVLTFIKKKSRLFGPTVREIAAHFGFRSLNAVVHHLSAIEKKGAIRRRKGCARAIEVTA